MLSRIPTFSRGIRNLRLTSLSAATPVQKDDVFGEGVDPILTKGYAGKNLSNKEIRHKVLEKTMSKKRGDITGSEYGQNVGESLGKIQTTVGEQLGAIEVAKGGERFDIEKKREELLHEMYVKNSVFKLPKDEVAKKLEELKIKQIEAEEREELAAGRNKEKQAKRNYF